jgi:hypothetical protein
MTKPVDAAKAAYDKQTAAVESLKAGIADTELDALRGKLAEVEARLREATGAGADEMRLASEAAALRAMLGARISGVVAGRKELEAAQRRMAEAQGALESAIRAEYAPSVARLEAGLGKLASDAEPLFQAAYDSAEALHARYGVHPRGLDRVRVLRAAHAEARRVLGLKLWRTAREVSEAEALGKSLDGYDKRAAEAELKAETARLDGLVTRGLLAPEDRDAILDGERKRKGL